MPTIDHRARSAQYPRSFFHLLHSPRAALVRLVLLAAVAGAAYAPGMAAAHLLSPSSTHGATLSSHAAVAVQPLLPCPGATLPC